MFTDQQLDQLRQLLAVSEEMTARRIEKTQGELEAKISEVNTKLSSTQEEMTNAQKDQAALFQDLTVQIDKNKREIIDTLTERMSVALTHHDKRITRVEKHLDLPPLE